MQIKLIKIFKRFINKPINDKKMKHKLTTVKKSNEENDKNILFYFSNNIILSDTRFELITPSV